MDIVEETSVFTTMATIGFRLALLLENLVSYSHCSFSPGSRSHWRSVPCGSTPWKQLGWVAFIVFHDFHRAFGMFEVVLFADA